MKKRDDRKIRFVHLFMFVLAMVMSCAMFGGTVRETKADGEVKINEDNFPDQNFRNWVKYNVGNGDDELTQAELESVTSIDVFNHGIGDLTGIEYFMNITSLDCSHNQLKELDVRSNTQLQDLYCDNNQLKELNVNANTQLQDLDCDNNQLKELDVSANTQLQDLDCSDNQLKELGVSANTQLQDLDCADNQLKELDVSANTQLQDLECDNNQLKELDVSANTQLQDLDCSYNFLSFLDLSQSEKLNGLRCDNSQLVSLKLNDNAPLSTYFNGGDQKVAIKAAQTSPNGDYVFDLETIDPDIDMTKFNITSSSVTTDGTKLIGLKKGEAVDFTYTVRGGKELSGTITATATLLWNEFTTPLSIEGWTYGDKANLPQAKALRGEVTFTYASKTNRIFGPLPENPSPGTWYVKATVEETDEYIGLSDIKSFEIKERPQAPKQMISKTVVSKIKARAYSGYKKKPTVTVKYEGKKLKKGTDYTVIYQNNTKVGTAKVIIKGKGNYTGTRTVTFKIKKRTKYAKGIYVVKTKALKGHTKAGSKKPVKCYYSKGDKVEVLKVINTGKKYKWLKVKRKGKVSYVYAKYLKL